MLWKFSVDVLRNEDNSEFGGDQTCQNALSYSLGNVLVCVWYLDWYSLHQMDNFEIIHAIPVMCLVWLFSITPTVYVRSGDSLLDVVEFINCSQHSSMELVNYSTDSKPCVCNEAYAHFICLRSAYLCICHQYTTPSCGSGHLLSIPNYLLFFRRLFSLRRGTYYLSGSGSARVTSVSRLLGEVGEDGGEYWNGCQILVHPHKLSSCMLSQHFAYMAMCIRYCTYAYTIHIYVSM